MHRLLTAALSRPVRPSCHFPPKKHFFATGLPNLFTGGDPQIKTAVNKFPKRVAPKKVFYPQRSGSGHKKTTLFGWLG